MQTIHPNTLPAEWEKHQFTLLAFPYEGRDWPGKFHAVKWAFVEIIRKVSTHEDVLLLVRSALHQEKVKGMLVQAHVDLKKVKFLIQDTNRGWMRDSGPIIVKDAKGGRTALQFGFNGWAKYGNYRKDLYTPQTVAESLKIPLRKVIYKDRDVVLEGGAIDSNGQGTLITTAECLLHPSIQVRNPGFSKLDYEEIFASYLGIKKTIWLGAGIEGDDTHGHVDDICRFVNVNTVVACREINPKDKNHKILEANLEQLRSETIQNGEKLNVIEIPMPSRLDFEDLRLPASYVNFLITNASVLVPTFNDKNDYKALRILREVFPDRDVIGISAIDLIWGLGTLHCLSHEIPH
ncbi:MAG: agmatine deiminase family protein [Bacteroidales bacterium]|nr:agmatine deiminase family protein [Bacteroidales bacterium]MCB9013930.1 agmatine deiminase family protein [Bacteroidales bacterium]